MTNDFWPDSSSCSRKAAGMLTRLFGSMVYSNRPRKIIAAVPTFPHNYPLAAILMFAGRVSSVLCGKPDEKRFQKTVLLTSGRASGQIAEIAAPRGGGADSPPA